MIPISPIEILVVLCIALPGIFVYRRTQSITIPVGSSSESGSLTARRHMHSKFVQILVVVFIVYCLGKSIFPDLIG
jgi:hypothetical protein